MTRRRSLFRFLAFAALWVLSTLILFRLFAGPASSRGVVTHTITSSADTPEDFRFLMFPVAAGALLYDRPDGKSLQPPRSLNRALAKSKEEIDAGGWFRVLHTDTHRWVRATDLAYLPDDAEADALIAQWRDLFTSPGFGFSDAAVRITPASRAGWQLVSLRLTPIAPDPEDGKAWNEYVYETDGKSAVARSFRRYSAKEQAFGGAASAVMAGIVASGSPWRWRWPPGSFDARGGGGNRR